MNIIISINEKYIEPAKTMLYSLACHQKEHLVIYLLQSSIRKEMLEDFREFLADRCHASLVLVPIDRALFAGAPKKKWLSEETYYRLISFALLPEEVERALWLDGDIIIKGNISELYLADFENQYAVVCAEDSTKHHKRLGLSLEHRYFNAGVVLYNMKLIQRDFAVQDVFDCIEKHKDHLDLMDQDVLNVMFENHVKYMDAQVYNNETWGFHVLGKSKMKELKEKAKIIHYKGSMKPWNPKGANWADGYWWRYEKARGGRRMAALRYSIPHGFVKMRLVFREMYYVIQSQARKIRK